MKKTLLSIFYIIFFANSAFSEKTAFFCEKCISIESAQFPQNCVIPTPQEPAFIMHSHYNSCIFR